MFLFDGFGGNGEPALPETREIVVLWSLRCLSAAAHGAGPMARSAKVEAALLRQFGGAGEEMGPLLRCLTQLLQPVAKRVPKLIQGCSLPSCGAHHCLGATSLSAHELALLAALRGADHRVLAPLVRTGSETTASDLLGLIGQLMRRDS
jgi:hypothetical protein